MQQSKNDDEHVERMGFEWRGVFKAGGVCAVGTGLFFFCALASIVAYGTNPPTLMSAQLPYISAHATLWELAYGSLLMASIFSIPALIGLYFALRRVNKAFASIGTGVAVVSIPIFLAGVVDLLSVVPLGNSYNSAVGTTLASSYLAATAANIASGLLLQEIAVLITGVGTIVLSIAMLKGVLGRATGALGIVSGALAFPSVASSPILALVTILFAVWFILVGWKLYRISS
jgi:hypothetical protein